MKETFKYKIADLKVLVEHSSSVLQKNARKYLNDFLGEPDISVSISDERINAALEYNKSFDKDYAEYFLTGSDFYKKLIKFNGFMIHASCVSVDGNGYIFSADSGVGKSTHTSLWKEYLGDRATIINDDKPAVRNIDGKFFVYGTPWSGKEDISCNIKSKVAALVFLERDTVCSIKRLAPSESVSRIMPQMSRYLSKDSMDIQLGLLDEFLSDVPSYVLRCNPYIESAEIAWQTLSENS